MISDSGETDVLLRRAREGEAEALGDLLRRYSGRLERMVRLRIDRRLQGRIDVADVLQEAFLVATRAFDRYSDLPTGSFFVWLRRIVERQIIDVHRRHLGAQARDARREISIDQGLWTEATSAALAAHLLGSLPTPSEAAVRAELRARIEAALDALDPLDREVLALRHFEQLTNGETAEVLGIRESAASKRHLRALERLKEVLKGIR